MRAERNRPPIADLVSLAYGTAHQTAEDSFSGQGSGKYVSRGTGSHKVHFPGNLRTRADRRVRGPSGPAAQQLRAGSIVKDVRQSAHVLSVPDGKFFVHGSGRSVARTVDGGTQTSHIFSVFPLSP
jgi:hypothetical protein